MNRSRTALAIAAGVAAGVTVVAVGVVAAGGHAPSRTGSAGDSLELQALSQLQGASASPSASGSAPSSAPGFRGPRAGGLGRGLLGGGLLHGDVVVQGPDGKPVNVAIQRGTVTSVGGSTLVVRSTDGFVETWTTDTTTRYVLPGRLGRGPWTGLRPRAQTSPSPAPSASPSGPKVIKGSVVLVLGRTQGAGRPTARLVVNVPDGAGLGFGRFGPGGPGGRFGGPGSGRFGGPGPHRFGPSGGPRERESAPATPGINI
jgi:hypothetical protein